VEIVWATRGNRADELLKNPRSNSSPSACTGFFRNTAAFSTTHSLTETQACLHRVNFSTNPHHSSQQQGSFRFLILKILLKAVKLVKKTPPLARNRIPQSLSISTASPGPLPFILARKTSTVR